MADHPSLERRLVWLGNSSLQEMSSGRRPQPAQKQVADATLSRSQAQWLQKLIEQATPQNNKPVPYPWFREAQQTFPGDSDELADFLNGPGWKKARKAGLLLV